MNVIDEYIISLLNRFAHRSETFDQFVELIARNYVLKTGVLLVLLYWAWFRKAEGRDHRPVLVFGVIASCAAVLVTRILSLTVPFRERPLRNPDLHFVLPYSVSRQAISDWSSFPSDNATLFFAVAMCIYLISRPAGIVAFCHTFVVVAFARVYLGFHYPTDVLAGVLLGVGTVSLVRVPSVKAAVNRAPMRWLQDQPQVFSPAFFFVLFLIGTTFEPLYPFVRFLLATARAAFRLTPM